MNSKKNKKQSWVKCNPNSSLNPEVLVLPPDILEKLGINLGTIQHSKEISHAKDALKGEKPVVIKFTIYSQYYFVLFICFFNIMLYPIFRRVEIRNLVLRSLCPPCPVQILRHLALC